MKKSLFLFAVAALLVNCTDEPNHRLPQTVFEINVYPGHVPTGQNYYAILHDQDGNLLDYKPYSAGELLAFETDANITSVSVTFFHTTDDTHYVLRTYTGLEVFGELELFPPYVAPEHTSPVIGTGSIAVTDPNIGSASNAILHDGYDGVGAFNTTAGGVASVSISQFDVRQESNHILSVRDKNDIPYYRYLQNGQTGHRSFSLSDFENFDDLVTLQFPSTGSFFMLQYAYPSGMQLRDENCYLLQQHFGNLGGTTPKSSLSVGFLNDFLSFRTVGVAYYQGYMLGIESAGPKPQSLQITDIDVEVTDDSFMQFELNSSDDISWFVSTWVMEVGKQGVWSVFSENLDAKHPQQLPQEVLTLMSVNSFANFNLGLLRVQKGTRTYAQVIDQRLQGADLTPYQEVFKDMSF